MLADLDPHTPNELVFSLWLQKKHDLSAHPRFGERLPVMERYLLELRCNLASDVCCPSDCEDWPLARFAPRLLPELLNIVLQYM